MGAPSSFIYFDIGVQGPGSRNEPEEVFPRNRHLKGWIKSPSRDFLHCCGFCPGSFQPEDQDTDLVRKVRKLMLLINPEPVNKSMRTTNLSSMETFFLMAYLETHKNLHSIIIYIIAVLS